MTVARIDYEYQVVKDNESGFMKFCRQGVEKIDEALGLTAKYGPPQQWEDITIDLWIKQANNPEKGFMVPRAKEHGIAVSADEIQGEYTTDQFKYTHSLNFKGPIGKLGKWLSLSENYRQDLLNMLYDETGELKQEMVEIARLLQSSTNENPLDITEIAVEDRKSGRAFLRYLSSEEAQIGINSRYYTGEYLKQHDNDKESLELEKIYGMLHEYVHAHKVSSRFKTWLSKEGSEKKVGEILAEIFEERGEELEDTELGEIYKAWAEYSRKYARDHSWISRLTKEITKPIKAEISESELEAIVESLELDAMLSGCETKEEVDAYVRDNLESAVEEKYARETYESTEATDEEEGDDSTQDADYNAREGDDVVEDPDAEATDGEPNAEEGAEAGGDPDDSGGDSSE